MSMLCNLSFSKVIAPRNINITTTGITNMNTPRFAILVGTPKDLNVSDAPRPIDKNCVRNIGRTGRDKMATTELAINHILSLLRNLWFNVITVYPQIRKTVI